MSASEGSLEQALTPGLAALGLVVEDITIVPAGKRRLVRVLVDRDIDVTATTEPVDPISLDDVAEATRVVDDELEASGIMGESAYTLEVSSPGTDRPLTKPRHFVRNIGRLATLTLDDGTKASGRIEAANDHSVTIRPEQGGKKAGAAAAEAQTFNYTSITGAKVQVEFARADAGEDE